MWSWQKPKPEPARVDTPIGEFVRLDWKNADWEAFITIGGVQIQVLANDIDGGPDSNLIKQMPSIIENLPLLEEAARREVTAISQRHHFDNISSSDDSDFTLGFGYEEEAWGETVFVDFKGDNVVGWSTVD